MKKALILLITNFLIIGCHSYKHYIIQDNICYIDDIIKEAELTFNLKKYDSILSIKNNANIIDNDTLKFRILKHKDNYFTTKKTNKKEKIEKWITYYPKGDIEKSTFIYLNGLIEIGKETHFDENGNITKIIDHRQADKYPICYKEALLIVEQKIGKRDSITSIRRDEKTLKNDTLYYWSVYVKEPDPANGFSLGKSWAFQINAKNGKLIKKLRVISNPG